MSDNVVKAEEQDQDDQQISEILTAAKNSTKQLALGVVKRILELLIKFIGVKGIVFGLTTYLYLTTDKINLYVWLAVTLVFIGGRYLDKFMDKSPFGGGK